ncbi:hypothetical protein DRF58_14575 [Epilithonimonas hispanica]|uniref:Uncharacterized protein n=1 Tax=Epilithonimonas hispanica TaxID=358687 RepID=A0A3D9CQT1_9FLAO|nr:hypothetical protein DRF58_14575 [Epilithonimonas hispanica]
MQFLFLFSCQSDEELQRQSNSKYEGDYIGSYEGNDKGEFSFKITDAGNIVGDLKYNNSTTNEEFLGYVQSTGTLSANTRSGFVFNGQITNFDNSTGKWTKNSESGTLSGTFRLQKK